VNIYTHCEQNWYHLCMRKVLGLDGLFVGTVSYADDIALLAPSPSALHLMLKHCEEFVVSRVMLVRLDRSAHSFWYSALPFVPMQL